MHSGAEIGALVAERQRQRVLPEGYSGSLALFSKNQRPTPTTCSTYLYFVIVNAVLYDYTHICKLKHFKLIDILQFNHLTHSKLTLKYSEIKFFSKKYLESG